MSIHFYIRESHLCHFERCIFSKRAFRTPCVRSFESPLDPQAGRSGCYINVRRCVGLSISTEGCLLQLKDPLEQFLPCSGFLSHCEMTYAVESDVKSQMIRRSAARYLYSSSHNRQVMLFHQTIHTAAAYESLAVVFKALNLSFDEAEYNRDARNIALSFRVIRIFAGIHPPARQASC